MATHSSTLAWKIPCTKEPGRLQSMGLLRVWHDWATFTFTFHFHALEKETANHSSVLGKPLQCSRLENPRQEPGGLPSMGSHRVGHNWSELAAAAACQCQNLELLYYFPFLLLLFFLFTLFFPCPSQNINSVSQGYLSIVILLVIDFTRLNCCTSDTMST